jgi:beta-glucosidase
MDTSLKLMAIGLAAVVYAVPQASGSAPAASVTTPAPSSTEEYATVAFNSSLATTYLPNDDYSNEQLAFLWDQVGPISTAAVTTVVEPTPDPSPFPQPNWIHPLVPSYNKEIEDAVLPDDFLWGVASACEPATLQILRFTMANFKQLCRLKVQPMLMAKVLPSGT